MDFLSRKALGKLKDIGNIGYAKVKSNLANIDIAVVKATRHDEEPPKEKYVLIALGATEDLQLRRHLRHVIEARLSRTKNWMVALKTLALIHRLITDCQQPIFSQEEEELQHQRSSHRKLLAWMSLRFDDRSSPIALECSLWVRKYSYYLGQRLHCNRIFSYDIVAENHDKITKDQEIDQLLESLTSFQILLGCLLDCTPPREGPIAINSLIQYALDLLVKECSYVYPAISFCLCRLLDSSLDMPIDKAVLIVDVYKGILQQSENLSEFYQASCIVLVKHGGHSQYPGPETFITEMERNVKNYRHRVREMEAIRSRSLHSEEERIAKNQRAGVKKEILQCSAIEKNGRWDVYDDLLPLNTEASSFSPSNSITQAGNPHDLRMAAALNRSAMIASSSSSYQYGDGVMCSPAPEYSYNYAFQLAGDQSWIDPGDVMNWRVTNPNPSLTHDMTSSSFSDPLPGIEIEHKMQQLELHQEQAMDDQRQLMACLHSSLPANDASNVGGVMETSKPSVCGHNALQDSDESLLID